MAKREKIFLVFAGAALVFGLLYFLVFSGPKKSKGDTEARQKAKLAETAKFSETLTLTLAKEAPGEAVAFIIAQAQAAWKRDPFAGKDLQPGDETLLKDLAGKGEAASQFTYSGYLSMMDKRMCIINGMDYEQGAKLIMPPTPAPKEGEPQAPRDYVIRNIYPDRVIIETQPGGLRIVVPLKE